jgi:hypothetical protein
MEIAKLVLEYIKAVIWPATVMTLCLTFRSEIRKVLARLRHAVFPGGVSVDLEEEVQEVKQLSEKVESAPPPPDRKRVPGIPLTEANARMIELGLTPTLSGLDGSYYRNLAQTDPILALAGLRIEIEAMTRNLAKRFGVQSRPSDPVYRLLVRLKDAGGITSDQMELALKILNLCNRAIHGGAVTKEEAEDVISAAEVLFRDFLAWLSWGFNDNWKPRTTGDS